MEREALSAEASLGVAQTTAKNAEAARPALKERRPALRVQELTRTSNQSRSIGSRPNAWQGFVQARSLRGERPCP